MATLFDDERAASPNKVGNAKREHSALPLSGRAEPLVEDAPARSAPPPAHSEREQPRALALTDVIAPRTGAGETLIRMAYRIGVPGHALANPFRRPAPTRIRATVENAAPGNRAAGMALRAGHFCVHGVRQPITAVDFAPSARLAPGLERTVHAFTWLADLAASAPREDCIAIAERITARWLDANQAPAKGPAWDIEHTGLRLLAWLVHAPLVLAGHDGGLKPRLLAAIEQTADWLDGEARRSGPGLGALAAWSAITAAGLLLPDGKPRRLYGEAGLIRALGDLVAEDGGTLSRCPAAQFEAIRTLTDCLACYEAVAARPPAALTVMRALLIPPLLALRHGDGGLGSWQGQGAISADRVAALIAATGERARPLADAQHWGYQALSGGNTLVQIDAAPPPRARHARCGCASTLAFEMSDGPARLVVNCGGAALAGGQVPARIGQALRASAAHSTLVIDDANSTAVMLHGQLGRGAETVEFERRTLGQTEGSAGGSAYVIEAQHDGYAARFGLKHSRTLALASDGRELVGEDALVPVSRKGKRGKVAFAIRFHLGRGVEVRLDDDAKGAALLAPGGRMWQFSLRPGTGDMQGGEDIRLLVEDSLWVDGEGRPHPTEQLVIEGLSPRSGGRFAWRFRKMG
jgi:uncharacterized heparinase superfamily protein